MSGRNCYGSSFHSSKIENLKQTYVPWRKGSFPWEVFLWFVCLDVNWISGAMDATHDAMRPVELLP